MQQEVELLKDLVPKWQKEPEVFFVDVLGVMKEHIWDKMLEVMHSVRDFKWTVVKAAHGVSKTFTAARIVLWFLYSFGPKATVITTAPTHHQVEEVLWREIRDAHTSAKLPLGGNLTKVKLELSEKWFAIGFSTRPDTVTQQATNFQGLHNEYVLIVFEEAAGIAKEIWDAAFSLMQGGVMVRFLAIGNPTSASGGFVDCFLSSIFNKITIKVTDTPNYKEGRNVIPGLSGVEFIDFVKEWYGEDSAYYRSRVLGEIPDEDIDALIPYSEIEKAIGRTVQKWNYEKRAVVWDVADGGDDAHELMGFVNTDLVDQLTLRSKKVEEAAPYVWEMVKKVGANTIIVDADFIGRVAVSLLGTQNVGKITIIPFIGSADAPLPDDFNSYKSWAAWQLRMMLINEEMPLPNQDELKEDLRHYRTDTAIGKGRIALEKKDDMKERLPGRRSPGKGDNYIMLAGEWNNIKPVERRKNDWKTVYKSGQPKGSVWAA